MRFVVMLFLCVPVAGCQLYQLRGEDPDTTLLEETYVKVGVPIHSGSEPVRDPVEIQPSRYDTLEERVWYVVSSNVSVYDKAFTGATAAIDHEIAVLVPGERFFLEDRFWVEGAPWFEIMRDQPGGPDGMAFLRVRDLESVTVTPAPAEVK